MSNSAVSKRSWQQLLWHGNRLLAHCALALLDQPLYDAALVVLVSALTLELVPVGVDVPNADATLRRVEVSQCRPPSSLSVPLLPQCQPVDALHLHGAKAPMPGQPSVPLDVKPR